jgi:hypothetical protein
MSGSCSDCGNVMCICDKDAPNNKFKIGQWVVGKDAIFKIDDIRVYGDSFGYSNHNMDGFFSQKDLIIADSELLLSILRHLTKLE